MARVQVLLWLSVWVSLLGVFCALLFTYFSALYDSSSTHEPSEQVELLAKLQLEVTSALNARRVAQVV